MEICRPIVIGVLESSDCQTTVGPGEGSIEFVFENAIINQYGNQIKRVVMETPENLGIKDVRIVIVDKGALNHTIRVRMKGAVLRVAGQYGNPPWEGTIR